MLPGLRFVFAATILTLSLLVVGLGAAALLRAAHQDFSSVPSRQNADSGAVLPPDALRPKVAALRQQALPESAKSERQATAPVVRPEPPLVLAPSTVPNPLQTEAAVPAATLPAAGPITTPDAAPEAAKPEASKADAATSQPFNSEAVKTETPVNEASNAEPAALTDAPSSTSPPESSSVPDAAAPASIEPPSERAPIPQIAIVPTLSPAETEAASSTATAAPPAASLTPDAAVERAAPAAPAAPTDQTKTTASIAEPLQDERADPAADKSEKLAETQIATLGGPAVIVGVKKIEASRQKPEAKKIVAKPAEKKKAERAKPRKREAKPRRKLHRIVRRAPPARAVVQPATTPFGTPAYNGFTQTPAYPMTTMTPTTAARTKLR